MYKILQFTDTHIGPMPFDEKDKLTFEHLEMAIKYEKPDLVIFTGDNVWSEGIEGSLDIFEYLCNFLNKFPVEVAITYGNHDTEGDYTRSQMRELEKLLVRQAEKTNVHVDSRDLESYTIELYLDNGKLSNLLYVFDSGAYAPKEIGGYDYISTEQIAWYNEVYDKYKEKLPNKNDLAFMHIPLPEYEEASIKIVQGFHHETDPRFGSPDINTGLFMNMYTNGNISAVFAGHDHESNFKGSYLGIDLIYGNVSGYHCYGALPRGYRRIMLSPDSYQTDIVLYSDIA